MHGGREQVTYAVEEEEDAGERTSICNCKHSSPVNNCKKLIHFDVISFRIVPPHVLSASTLGKNIFNDILHQQHTVVF
ncbi:hypothetical protein SK128_005560 [Halocaridina rubra]|uniref:Uncharacterized protein n=1 Tax=Halocaridina rubra TaxID=373956 RepID=A0AAN9AGH0_HALRR